MSISSLFTDNFKEYMNINPNQINSTGSQEAFTALADLQVYNVDMQGQPGVQFSPTTKGGIVNLSNVPQISFDSDVEISMIFPVGSIGTSFIATVLYNGDSSLELNIGVDGFTGNDWLIAIHNLSGVNIPANTPISYFYYAPLNFP